MFVPPQGGSSTFPPPGTLASLAHQLKPGLIGARVRRAGHGETEVGIVVHSYVGPNLMFRLVVHFPDQSMCDRWAEDFALIEDQTRG